MNSRHILRKKAVACLPGILCLSCLTPYAEAKMNFEELVQRLDAAEPWSAGKVESVFGAKLVPEYSNGVIAISVMGPFIFEEGLLIEEVHHRLKDVDNGMVRLIVSLSDEASCFTLDRVKKAYPDTRPSPFAGPRGQSLDEEMYRWTERPWGHIAFGFKERRRDCLASVVFIPRGEE